MKLKQLSLFLENKPGNVRKACRTLADAGINIETMALADTEQYGILRLLINDWERARDVFESNGVVVRLADVIAVVIEHRPGRLADVLDILDDGDLNIEYMYGFYHRTKNAIIVFRFNDPDKAIEKIQAAGIQMLNREELFI